MKLILRILSRLIPVLFILVTLWGIFFYVAIMEEVNDETDDALESYSEVLIARFLTGQELPPRWAGTNNTYELNEVTETHADENRKIRYSDEMVYIPEKEETEPARTLKTIFKDEQDRYFELSVSIPNIEKKDLKEAILQWIIFLYCTLLFIIIIVNLWVFQKSMKPLYILLKWLENQNINGGNPPLENKTGIKEFKKLNDAVLRNAERNKVIFEQQKQFISNASHELQTPLAICRNRLEMLADSDTLTEDQLCEILKTQESLDYIIRLNKSLLFLSKIDNGQFHEKKEVIFNELLHKHLPDYEEAYGHLEINVKVEEEGSLCSLMDEALASALVTNLLKNAFFHNYPHGQIIIGISNKKLVFANTGSETPLDREHIFERFQQNKNKKEGSTGLGLSITAAICKLYHLKINYYHNGMHCFEIIFP